MPFFDRMGLQARIMLLALSGLLVLFGFFGYIGLQAVQQSTQLLFQERITIARTIAADIEGTIAYSVKELEKMASLAPMPSPSHSVTEVPPSQDTSGCLTMCHDRAKVNVSQVGIASAEGSLLRLEPHDFGAFEGGGRSRDIQQAIQQALLRAKTHIAEVVASEAKESARVLIATPIRDDAGTVSGALVLEIDPFSRVSAINPGADVSEAGYGVEVVNERGFVIAGFGQRSTAGEISQHMFVAASLLKEGKAGAAIHKMFGGSGSTDHDHVVAFAPLSSVPWGVMVDQNPETALGPLQALQRNIFLFGAVALVVTLAIVWVTTRQVVRPVGSLTVASQKIAAGDLEYPIAIKGRDEIGLLARSFEEMRHKLKASQREIEAWNRALEERVQRRTQELSTLVEISQVLASTLELDTVLEATMAKTRQIFPQADAGALFLYDEAKSALVLKTSFGFLSQSSGTLTLSPGESGVGRAFVTKTIYTSHKEPLPVRLLQDLSPDNKAYLQEVRDNRAESCVCVPLIHEEKPIGSLVVYHLRHRGSFSAPDVQLLGALVNQATIAIVNARLFKEASEVGALRELDRLKTEFVARASHELRTPLTSIKSLAETLLRPDLSLPAARRRQFLEGINIAADRLASIITDLLTVSRIESGKMEVHLKVTPLRPLVERMIQQVRSQDAGRTLSVKIPAELPPVLVDPNRLEDILTNLLSNALKYSPSHTGVTVRASLRAPGEAADHSPEEGPMVVVSVTDEGVGISPEGMLGLFRRFGRVDDAAQRGVAGVGLGLYICKVYVEAMGGFIWAQSTPGKGSTFSFTLPVAPAGPSAQPRKDVFPAGKQRTSAPDAVGVGRVLVVDDDPDVLQAAQINLRGSGFDVLLADNGEQCLSIMETQHVDVVVLDVALPGIDGLEVARRLRASPKTREIPIIFLTAMAQDEDEARAWAVGGNEYIRKPFSPLQLCDLVARMMPQN